MNKSAPAGNKNLKLAGIMDKGRSQCRLRATELSAADAGGPLRALQRKSRRDLRVVGGKGGRGLQGSRSGRWKQSVT